MKTVRNLILVGALTLGGCAGTLPPVDNSTVTQIQNTATQICGFVPTVTTVANIIAAFTGGGDTINMVSQAAQSICAAVTSKGAKLGGKRAAVINGHRVVVSGKFVR